MGLLNGQHGEGGKDSGQKSGAMVVKPPPQQVYEQYGSGVEDGRYATSHQSQIKLSQALIEIGKDASDALEEIERQVPIAKEMRIERALLWVQELTERERPVR